MSYYELELLVMSDVGDELHRLYDRAIKQRADNAYEDPQHQDSGFDLYIPKDLQFQPWETQLLDLKVRCAAYRYDTTSSDTNVKTPTAFYIYPRSSISKTPFRLANGTGIIDSGYRGNLKGAFDNTKPTSSLIIKYSRLLQICMPDLSPFKIRLVESLDRTRRGGGGFGSTGS